MTATIHHGDCLDVLRAMPDNSVDAVVCDPPYGLSNTTPEKVTDTIVRWAQGDREHVPTGKGFMGASWDAFVPPVAVWDECLRVLKPGGHLVAFAGSRTQDLMGLSIRLAGFDIRENLAWIYGSGFPKSLDIGKAIDKTRDDYPAIREVVAFIREAFAASDVTRAELDDALGGPAVMAHFLALSRSNAGCPTLEQWQTLKAMLQFDDSMDAEVWWLNGRKGSPGENWDLRPITQEGKGGRSPGGVIKFDQRASSDRERRDIAATPEAKKWQGWGTATKPAHEPVILARKPFPGTVAANTLEWGTGGLNIDATRIATTDKLGGGANKAMTSDTRAEGWARPWMDDDEARDAAARRSTESTARAEALGRWPANVVLDPDTAHALDEQSDGASRFFKVVEPDPPFMYAAKAPKKERPSYVNDEGKTIQHSTVKPLSIISWLCRLTCPPGGTILDPFAGSGTAIEAAMLEGFNVIGIEREADYLPLIQQRIDRAEQQIPVAS